MSSACPDSVIVRTSLLVGGATMSSHEATVRDVIGGHSAMSFFTDEIRCPVLVDDLAAALLQLVVRPDLTGVLHLAGPDAMSRAELAVRVARRHGWDPMAAPFGTLAESGLQRPAGWCSTRRPRPRSTASPSAAPARGISVTGRAVIRLAVWGRALRVAHSQRCPGWSPRMHGCWRRPRWPTPWPPAGAACSAVTASRARSCCGRAAGSTRSA